VADVAARLLAGEALDALVTGGDRGSRDLGLPPAPGHRQPRGFMILGWRAGVNVGEVPFCKGSCVKPKT